MYYGLFSVCKIEGAEDDTVLRLVCQTGCETIIDSGYTRSLASIRISDKANLIRNILLHATIYRVKAVLDQLKEGLSILAVGEAMCNYPNLMEPLFVTGVRPPLTAGWLGHTCLTFLIHFYRHNEIIDRAHPFLS